MAMLDAQDRVAWAHETMDFGLEQLSAPDRFLFETVNHPLASTKRRLATLGQFARKHSFYVAATAIAVPGAWLAWKSGASAHPGGTVSSLVEHGLKVQGDRPQTISERFTNLVAMSGLASITACALVFGGLVRSNFRKENALYAVAPDQRHTPYAVDRTELEIFNPTKRQIATVLPILPPPMPTVYRSANAMMTSDDPEMRRWSTVYEHYEPADETPTIDLFNPDDHALNRALEEMRERATAEHAPLAA